MRVVTRWLYSMGIAGIAIAISGCGEAETGPELLIPVSGVVKVDGQPAPGVAVTFLPDGQTAGTGGFAATDAQGQFTVKHRSGEEGIEPGKYRVVMSQMLKPDGSPVPSGESAMDHNATEALPDQYTDAEATPFQQEITEQMEPLTFELSSR